MPGEIEPDVALLSAYRSGDQEAARQLFERYYERLLGLIRRQSGWRLKEMEGSVDLAQSVWQNFFTQLRDQQVDVGGEAGLWPLLVTITLNKVRNRAKFWQRERRDVARQTSLTEGADPLELGPSPDDAAVLEELIERLLAPFSDRRRRTLQMILEGYSVEQIAAEVGTTARTIYNTRQAAARILAQLLEVE